ncbi:MAG TPA: NAD(+) synthase [Solirubrobacteraceae bacterium]|nr:NAD(+) synthase [Solirubrobacteraceae bacterium]
MGNHANGERTHPAQAARRPAGARREPPPFASPYAHGFVRLAAAVPRVRIGDPRHNGERTLELARAADERGAALVAFPELGLIGYSSEDLHRQHALIDAAQAALASLLDASAGMRAAIVVGMPVLAEGGLFNAAVVLHGGRILGAVPKSYVPEYREYYEKRQFRAARDLVGERATVLGEEVLFSPALVFDCETVRGFSFAVEICEDLWAPVPPSSLTALAGALVLVNLSASNVTIGKDDYRRMLCRAQSGRAIAAYLYAASGLGESTTDMAWDGQALIYENGRLLAESQRFSAEPQLVVADVDLERLQADRMATSSWGDTVGDLRARLGMVRRVRFALDPPTGPLELEREVERFPYVPSDPRRRDERCEEVYAIQVAGLRTRLEATGIERLVIGVSGGLDSAHALTVAVRAVDGLGLPRTNVLAYTMPGFATSRRTLDNARALMDALGVSAAEIDIRPAAMQMLRDIGHPAAAGEARYDVTYENVQAGERTSHLFRLANLHGALVVGTGDLSELALGWSTYGVGDQMSHYNVNASVPKTLIRFLVAWVAQTGQLGAAAGDALRAVLGTEISPELIPDRDGSGERPVQLSEDTVGPYELADFFLYHVVRFGLRPSKIAYLAHCAWGDARRGAWPAPEAGGRGELREYSLEEIARWLEAFLVRFFQTSQFKRSAMPNGPKVGSGGSLSPRSDWRAPSDASAAAWLAELRAALAGRSADAVPPVAAGERGRPREATGDRHPVEHHGA